MVLDLLAEAKVSQLEHFIVDENVVRFDVTVDELGIIEDLIAPADLLQNVPDPFFRHEGHLRNQAFK